MGSSGLSCPKCIISETTEVSCASFTEEIPPSGLKRLAEALCWLQHMTLLLPADLVVEMVCMYSPASQRARGNEQKKQ